MNTIAVIAFAFSLTNPPVCGIDWRLPEENERPFRSLSVTRDTFKLAAGFDSEFINRCADEGDIIYPTMACLIQAEWMHQNYLNCLTTLNEKTLEETP